MSRSEADTTNVWSCLDSGYLPLGSGFWDAGKWCVSGCGCWFCEWVQFVNIH